jgi:hypothetical protein
MSAGVAAVSDERGVVRESQRAERRGQRWLGAMFEQGRAFGLAHARCGEAQERSELS